MLERAKPCGTQRLLACGALLALGLCQAATGGQSDSTAPDATSFVLEDFEAATLGGRPYFWKEGRQNAADSTIGVERALVPGATNGEANKALQIEYQFPAAAADSQGVEAGPMGQALPGSLTRLTLQVQGDGSGNALVLRLQDRQGEAFEWEAPVGAKGWHQVAFPLTPATAKLVGRRMNGTPDAPLTFQAMRVARKPAGQARGTVLMDNLMAECRFGAPKMLYDPTAAVQPEAWKVIKSGATIGAVAASRASGEREVAALKLSYAYENDADASVEYQRLLPTGTSHGTLAVELFGDGSNNLLRFRFRDAGGRVWSANWAQALIDWSGWKTLYLDTRTLLDPLSPGPATMPDKFPLSFQGLVVDDCSPQDRMPGVESGRKGELSLGRLTFYPEP